MCINVVFLVYSFLVQLLYFLNFLIKLNLSRTVEEKDGFITDIQRIGRFGTVRIDRVPDTGQDIGLRIQGSGYRVQDTGFRIQGSGRRVLDTLFRIQGSGHRAKDTRFRIKVRI